MTSRGLLLWFFVAFAVGPSISEAATQWTFCVASEGETKNVWITQVFPAFEKRETLESELKAILEGAQLSHIDVQCPRPSDDKVAVINAQTAAAEFNRKLEMTLHEVPARDFPLSR
jgi:hypothetical protein